jgi:host cell surface-exposed lipoprotein
MLKGAFTAIAVVALIGAGGAPATASTTANRDAATVTAVALQGLTPGQANAVRAARGYLSYTAFSRSGLIGQLKYEGYSTRNATFAVDYITVSWYHQAVRSGKAYLGYSPFSLSGLIAQLEYEGFTHRQAVYGARHALAS